MDSVSYTSTHAHSVAEYDMVSSLQEKQIANCNQALAVC